MKQNCETVQKALLLAYPEEPAEKAVRSHLDSCPECREFAAFQKKLMELPPALPHPAPALTAVRERMTRRNLRFWRAAFQIAAAASVLLAAALPAVWFGFTPAVRTETAISPQTVAAVPGAPVPTMQEIEELFAETDSTARWSAQELYADSGNMLTLNWDGETDALEQSFAMQDGDAPWQIDLTDVQLQFGKAVTL